VPEIRVLTALMTAVSFIEAGFGFAGALISG
jgi:hypothetical protein